MSELFHSTAIIHPKAKIGAGTKVGAYSIIGEHVVLGENCEVQEHVVLRGHTTMGKECRIFPFAVIGAEPQHLKYANEPTTVEIGDRVVLRESVTVNIGTEFGHKKTRIGSDSFIMAYAHVAHDCVLGKNVIIANSVQLAGHVEVGDFSFIGGQSAIAQFCRVGSYCYVGGGSILRKDLPPFLLGKGNDFEVQGINSVGLQRQGFTTDRLKRLKNVYKTFYLQGLTVNQAIEKIVSEEGDSEDVQTFLNFIRTSKLGFIR